MAEPEVLSDSAIVLRGGRNRPEDGLRPTLGYRPE